MQLIRLIYALLMPFANFLLIVSSQLVEGTALTLFKCSESALDDMIQSVVLFGKSLLLLFQSIAAFFGDASENSNVLVNDLDLETPLEMMSKAVGVLEQPFICSCNQFTKPIQSLLYCSIQIYPDDRFCEYRVGDTFDTIVCVDVSRRVSNLEQGSEFVTSCCVE